MTNERTSEWAIHWGGNQVVEKEPASKKSEGGIGMSGYPPEMQKSIHKVEATRNRRLKETFPAMSMEEREAILEAFHPDYKEETFQAIRVGVSKGQRMPIELACIVEGRPHIGAGFDLKPDGGFFRHDGFAGIHYDKLGTSVNIVLQLAANDAFFVCTGGVAAPQQQQFTWMVVVDHRIKTAGMEAGDFTRGVAYVLNGDHIG